MLYPQRRHRDRPVSYQENSCFVTVTDWKTGITNGSNILPPHAYEKTARFVYNKTAFVDNAFTPTSKTSFYAGGFYQTAYENNYPFRIQQKYWISKNNKSISWDIDSVYIDGAMTTLVSYADAHPHALAHDAIITCALSSKITQADYDAWAAAGFVNDVAVIGKQKLVVILYDKAIGYSVAVYALGITSITECYRRILPDYDWSIANNFVITGFKTDALTLVYWTQLYPTGGGVYKLVFNEAYTAETRTQLGTTSWPVYSETQTYSSTELPAVINGTITTNSTDAGNTVVDVFQHKDDFTVIYKRHGYSYAEVYSYSYTPNPDEVTTKSINNTETHDFYAAYVDWDTDSVVDAAKLIFHETAAVNSSVTNTNGSYSGGGSETDSLETKLLYAHYAKSLYVYRTVKYDSTGTYNVDSATTEITKTFKLIADHNGVKTTLAEFSETVSTTGLIQSDPTAPGNYNNSSGTYPVESYYYEMRRRAAFDGKLLIACYDLSDSDITTIESFRARPSTVIYKTNTEYQILNYRLDYSGDDRQYPLNVTNI